MSFWIMTDACCDLPTAYIRKQQQFTVAPMAYQIDGNVVEIDPADAGSAEVTHQFYERLRNGASATTFQINQAAWESRIEPILQQGDDLLVLPFSGGLSGTCQSAIAACDALRPRYPDRTLLAVDTLCASLGQGLLVHYALQQRAEGKDIQQTCAWLEENKLHIDHWFTVDNLMFLKRGGRVTATSAYLGTMLKIKPVLHVDDNGKLIPADKVQGRKRSLKALLEKALELGVNIAEQPVFISHGDSVEDAQWLANKIKSELGVQTILLNPTSPIIGSHTGPGMVAVFFLGQAR